MLGIENIAAFLLASLAVIVVPGPATLFVSARTQLGARHAMAGALGIAFGDVILMCASGVGLSSVVTQWPIALTALRMLGALYIAWLGISTIVSSRSQDAADGTKEAPSGAAAKEGLLLTLVNPKPMLFFAAFFPLFISRNSPSWGVSFAYLGAVYEVLNIAYYVLLILVLLQLKKVGALNTTPRTRKLASGLALLACSALVLFASNPGTDL